MTAFNIPQKGFTILFAVIVSSVVLAIGVTIVNISVKQFILSGISEGSEMAFYAANAGTECIKYWDYSATDGNRFDVPGDGSENADSASVICMGGVYSDLNGEAASGEEQRFIITWNDGELCTDISVWKFHSASGPVDIIVEGTDSGRDCPMNSECTVAKSRGYNRPCDELDTPRVVERELTFLY